jgi:hypothetical protein
MGLGALSLLAGRGGAFHRWRVVEGARREQQSSAGNGSEAASWHDDICGWRAWRMAEARTPVR